MFNTAKSMFPNMPDEVFDIFLRPLIKYYGWPFISVSDSIAVNINWFRIFYPCTLFAVSQLVWNRRGFSIFDTLHDVTEQDIKLIIGIHKGTYSEIGENRRTIARHIKTIMDTGSFSTPIILAQTPTGLKSFDGNHKITALNLIYMTTNEIIKADSWVGEIIT